MQKSNSTSVQQQLINNYFKIQERYHLFSGARGQQIEMQISPGFKQKTHESHISTSSYRYQTPNREKNKGVQTKGDSSVQPRKIKYLFIRSEADSVTQCHGKKTAAAVHLHFKLASFNFLDKENSKLEDIKRKAHNKIVSLVENPSLDSNNLNATLSIDAIEGSFSEQKEHGDFFLYTKEDEKISASKTVTDYLNEQPRKV